MARARLTFAQLVCSLLAVLVSLLTFAAVLQRGRGGAPGDGDAGLGKRAIMAVRLLDGDAKGRLSVVASLHHAGTATAPVVAAVSADASAAGRAPDIASDLAFDPASDTDPDPGFVTTGSLTLVDASAWSAHRNVHRNGPPTGYVPVAELSERPVLLQDIDQVIDLSIEGIADPNTESRQQATGILLINETGHVDRLQFDSDELPRYLETVLAQRFATARFLPGKIDGKPVRSALHIALQLQ